MGNLPTLKVLLDDGAGTFPFDITSKVLATDGYAITRGRDDWQSAVTAGELSLTLNNSDGRFTPGSTLIASPSPIVVDRRIRLQEIVNGSTFTRFTGYVKSWPVEWPETVATFAKVRLSATDAQARAERRPLRTVIEEEVFADSPRAYYTISEAAGSTTAGDTSGNQLPPLAIAGSGTALNFGATMGTTSPTACVSFAGGTYLQNQIPAVYVPAGSAYTIECYFATTLSPALPALMLSVDAGVGFAGSSAFLAISSTGKLQASTAGAALFSPSNVNDGLVHHAMLTLSAGGAQTLYLDGLSVASNTGISTSVVDLTGFSVARADVGAGISQPYVGTVAHATAYTTALSAGRVASHASARTGFGGESGTARITRLAGYAGIPVGTLDPSLTNLSGHNFDGSTAWTEVAGTVDAEMGVAFIDGTGSIAFHNRNRVVAKTVPDLTLTSQWITPDVTPVLDDQQIVNYMEVTAEGTGATWLARSATSETSHGRYSGSRTYSVQTDAEALDRANWLLGDLAEPGTRYGTLTINLYNMAPSLAATVLTALDIDCWLRVTSMASQNPGGTTADVIVQAWQETVSAENWTITCNVVARSLFSPVWILDNTTFSVLDSTTRLYV